MWKSHYCGKIDSIDYTSKPLHDYIYECNQGYHLNFVAGEEEVISRFSV